MAPRSRRRIREELRPRVAAFTERDRPAAGPRHRARRHACAVGDLRSQQAEGGVGHRLSRRSGSRLPEQRRSRKSLDAVARSEREPAHDGILVQDPAAGGRSAASQAVFDVIDPAKDVDGFTPVNAGLLVQNRAVLAPCTPSGVIELLERRGIAIAGQHAVVIGRSDIVGKPMALLLLHRARDGDDLSLADARSAVADAGRRTSSSPRSDAPRSCARAREAGATVIDVGINRVTDRSERGQRSFPRARRGVADFDKRGAVVVGDVHPGVAEVAGALTPVPGGVGPLTIALLLQNTVTAAEHREP